MATAVLKQRTRHCAHQSGGINVMARNKMTALDATA